MSLPSEIRRQNRVPDRCLWCGTASPVPIVFGLPDGELEELADRGEVILGGCVVTGNDPRWRCRSCGATSRGPKTEDL